jgi:23S rRNA (uracil1939-C5)-methyltransferase
MPSRLAPRAEIVVTAEKPVAGGRMLARHNGQIVLVAGAIPGERVRARVERVSKQVMFAEAMAVLEASPDRRSGRPDWACGGSFYTHIAYPRQLSLKSELVADAFRRIARLTLDARVPVVPSAEQGYRMRARLHARQGKFGFFREGTHDLCDAGPTEQLLPATIDALGRLERALREQGVTDPGSCEIAENAAATERVMVVEMVSHHRAWQVEPLDGITGLAVTEREHPRLNVVYGSPYLVDRVEVAGAAVALTHHAQSFFQGNRYLLQDLVSRVVGRVPQGDVVDLYAGVGLFAVALAALGREGISAVEGDRSSARDLEANAAPYLGKLSISHASVEDYLRRSAISPGTILLDPPRTGLSREAMSGLVRLAPRSVVYLSCDLATLARDVKPIVEAGYRLEHIEAFDLFPNTAHVETLVVMRRG